MARNFRIGASLIIYIFLFSCNGCISEKKNESSKLCRLYIILPKNSCPSCEFSVYNFLVENEYDEVEFLLAYDNTRTAVLDPISNYKFIKKVEYQKFKKLGLVTEDMLEKVDGTLILFVESGIVKYQDNFKKTINWSAIDSICSSCNISK